MGVDPFDVYSDILPLDQASTLRCKFVELRAFLLTCEVLSFPVDIFPYYFCWQPCGQCLSGNVFCDYCSRRDDRTVSNGNTFEDNRIRPDPDVVPNDNRLALNMVMAKDAVVVGIPDYHVICDGNAVTNLYTVPAEDGTVVVHVPASQFQLGPLMHYGLTARTSTKITVD